MEPEPRTKPRGFSTWFFGALAAVLTAGLIVSLLVMLYALIAGLIRHFHG